MCPQVGFFPVSRLGAEKWTECESGTQILLRGEFRELETEPCHGLGRERKKKN